MVEGTVESIEVDATPQAVFAVAVDVARYPEWASGVRTVQVLEADAQGRPHRAHFVIDGFVKEIAYDLVYDYEEPHRMRWTAEPGPDLELLDGSYSFTPTDEGGTQVVYGLKVQPTFAIPGFVRRQAEHQIVTTALRGLRRRVQELEIS